MKRHETSKPFHQPRVRAPKLPSDPKLWLNTGGRAISLTDLKGRVVLLDFWTYGCINCQRVLPGLKYLEAKYAAKPFTVIGVHSGKFDNEKDGDHIRAAILRLDIRHPVVRADDYRVWDEYSVHAWPTFVLLDPQGYVVGSVSGEGNRARLDAAIAELLTEFEAQGLTEERSLTFPAEISSEADARLMFPGKVLADAAGGRLFIADTGHNRLIVSDPDGRNPVVIGSGEAGSADGKWEGAAFCGPQGMALVGNALFVCDCGNHLLRRVDLETRTVSTVAGTGEQGTARVTPGSARNVALSSPWDICYLDQNLYVAMAGTHQIWRYDLKSGNIGPFAGSGREARRDGSLKEAAFAQPSGITTDDVLLFVADSESSSIRQIMLGEKPTVTTLAGGDLFTFGDEDGKGDDVRLQHPLGVCEYGGQIYIADTYNHRIKVLTPEISEVRTLAGTGESILLDSASPTAAFYEPSGLSVANDQLFIADTNNHRIRVLNLAEGTVETLDFPGLPALPPSESSHAAK